MILAKKVDYGQKIRFCEKKVGNFSTSKCSKNCAFRYFSKKNFLRGLFRLKKRPLKGFCKKTKRTVFLAIFVNFQKRLETAVLEGHCKFSMKSIICKKYLFLVLDIVERKFILFMSRKTNKNNATIHFGITVWSSNFFY